MDHRKLILASLILVLSLTGCQSSAAAAFLSQIIPQEAATPTALVDAAQPEPTPLPSAVPTEELPPAATEIPTAAAQPVRPTSVVLGIGGFAPNINPLTGLAVSDPSILERRPVFVKVSNFPALTSRPQAGLSFADIVFEYYIGEYTNRFLAIFYGQDTEKAWPLRSGRLIDPQLTNMYQGVLVYGNADDKVDDVILQELGERAISFDNAPCPPICGEATHSASGVYVNSAEVSKFANRHGILNQRYPLDGMIFKPDPPANGQDAFQVDVQFIRWNRSEWHYDPASGKYLRWTELWDQAHKEATDEHPMIPHVEQLTGEQLAFSNIIVLFAYYAEYAPTLHDVEIWDNAEKQPAVFFRDGIMEKGYWFTPAHDKPIQFFNENGTPMALKPGNSWIVIAGHSSDFLEPEPGHWAVEFDIP